MNALGVGILDFLAENPSPTEIDTVRTQVVTPIRMWSATSRSSIAPFVPRSMGRAILRSRHSLFITEVRPLICHHWC